MNLPLIIATLEIRRKRLHEYIQMKLDERDYHGIADAAMDLREIDRELKVRLEIDNERHDQNTEA